MLSRRRRRVLIVPQKKTLTAHARATGPPGGHPCSKANKNRYRIYYYYCYRCYYNNLCGYFRLILRRRSSHLRRAAAVRPSVRLACVLRELFIYTCAHCLPLFSLSFQRIFRFSKERKLHRRPGSLAYSRILIL